MISTGCQKHPALEATATCLPTATTLPIPPGALTTAPQETTAQTKAVFVHHLQSLGGGRLEDVLSDNTEDSVLFTPDGVIKGLAGIREFFGSAIKIEGVPPDMMKTFAIIRQDIEGETVYLVWKAEPSVPPGTDTFIVRNGKIMVQTVFYGQ